MGIATLGSGNTTTSMVWESTIGLRVTRTSAARGGGREGGREGERESETHTERDEWPTVEEACVLCIVCHVLRVVCGVLTCVC